MKKIILILILAAFAGSVLQTEVQAAPVGKTLAIKNVKKSHKSHKKHHHGKKSKHKA